MLYMFGYLLTFSCCSIHGVYAAVFCFMYQLYGLLKVIAYMLTFGVLVQFTFGYGVGGEYPMAAGSAAERAEAKGRASARKRGQEVYTVAYKRCVVA